MPVTSEERVTHEGHGAAADSHSKMDAGWSVCSGWISEVICREWRWEVARAGGGRVRDSRGCGSLETGRSNLAEGRFHRVERRRVDRIGDGRSAAERGRTEGGGRVPGGVGTGVGIGEGRNWEENSRSWSCYDWKSCWNRTRAFVYRGAVASAVRNGGVWRGSGGRWTSWEGADRRTFRGVGSSLLGGWGSRIRVVAVFVGEGICHGGFSDAAMMS